MGITRLREDLEYQIDARTPGPPLDLLQFEHTILCVSGRQQPYYAGGFFYALKEAKGVGDRYDYRRRVWNATDHPLVGAPGATETIVNGQPVIDCNGCPDTFGGFGIQPSRFSGRAGMTFGLVARRPSLPAFTSSEDILSIAADPTAPDLVLSILETSNEFQRFRLYVRVIDPVTGILTPAVFAITPDMQLNKWNYMFGSVNYATGEIKIALNGGDIATASFTVPAGRVSAFGTRNHKAALFGRAGQGAPYISRPHSNFDDFIVEDGVHTETDGSYGQRIADHLKDRIERLEQA